jgi:hypothetical protein
MDKRGLWTYRPWTIPAAHTTLTVSYPTTLLVFKRLQSSTLNAFSVAPMTKKKSFIVLPPGSCSGCLSGRLGVLLEELGLAFLESNSLKPHIHSLLVWSN